MDAVFSHLPIKESSSKARENPIRGHATTFKTTRIHSSSPERLITRNATWNQFLLVACDPVSKWMKAQPLNNKRATIVMGSMLC